MPKLTGCISAIRHYKARCRYRAAGLQLDEQGIELMDSSIKLNHLSALECTVSFVCWDLCGTVPIICPPEVASPWIYNLQRAYLGIS